MLGAVLRMGQDIKTMSHQDFECMVETMYVPLHILEFDGISMISKLMPNVSHVLLTITVKETLSLPSKKPS